MVPTAPPCTCTRRPGRRAGATSSCSRRSPTWRSRRSPPWSTSPERCRWTARRRSRAACARPDVPTPDSSPLGGRGRPGACCPLYHDAVELIGRRWTGAILDVLLQRPSLRFSEIAQAVPALSDRLLSERMKELEGRGVVLRTVLPGPPLRVEYSLSQMGRELEPALSELQRWAGRWLRRRLPTEV